ncbi:nucleoside-binding protein [Alkalibaculum bacchi]|uniref:Nucleoside-binding protein n=1 Tax=Alkalibaculum bacchi TaxID=645887 RepID=A0A366HWK0_9FIRM|nr:BMP family ABC transporter substrate-binding protein [Alkalibaculum bacchi]RBP57645.1 nucleoside-binding protein [Alkalibaculum bacchi]
MKRFSIVFLIVALLAATTLGCSNNKSEKNGTQEDSTKPLTVGFIYIGPINDGGYTTSHDNGRVYLEEQMGDKIKTIYKENIPEEKGEVVKTIREMVDQGANMIFATSFGHMDGVLEAAKEFPEVTFAHCSGYEKAENMTNYFGRMYQARYLSGIVAGMKTESNVIGYVGAFPLPEVIRGINAFTLGVKSVNPDAEVHVRWTNTWYDPTTEKAAAEALLAEGADVTAQHQDSTAPMVAAQEKGATSIGYNLSAKESVPNAYITAPLWNWGEYYVDAVQKVLDGTWTNEPYWKGLESGIVSLDELTELAPGGAQEKVDEAKERIVSGEFDVFTGPIKDQKGAVKVQEGQKLTDQEMLTMTWFVEGVVGTIPAQ